MIGPAGFMAAPKLAARGLRPASELAASRPHGDRLRYIAGCKCDACRKANSAYERARIAARNAGDWNGIVSASKAQRHLIELSHAGVGRRSVRDVCGVAETVLSDIVRGRKTQIRARTERAILAVTKEALADHALVPAGPTWKLLDELISDGYTKTELARHLGCASHALQVSRHQVTVRNAYKVERMYEQLRCCCAAQSQRLLDRLADEGYTRRQIFAGLDGVAAEMQTTFPGICIRNGRIRMDVARMIVRLHFQLTE